MEARLLVFFCTKNRPPSCLFLDFCTHRVWYKPEIFVFGSCHVAVHLISSNVSDLGKSDVGYLQFPFVQKDLTPMKTTADPAVPGSGLTEELLAHANVSNPGKKSLTLS